MYSISQFRQNHWTWVSILTFCHIYLSSHIYISFHTSCWCSIALLSVFVTLLFECLAISLLNHLFQLKSLFITVWLHQVHNNISCCISLGFGWLLTCHEATLPKKWISLGAPAGCSKLGLRDSLVEQFQLRGCFT